MSGVGKAFFGDCDLEGQGMQVGSSTGFVLANSIGTVVTFDTIEVENPASSIFTFDDASDSIEVGEDGLYCVSYQVWTESGEFSPMFTVQGIRIRSNLEVDSGGGFSTAGKLNTQDWVLITSEQRTTQTLSQLLKLSAGDRVRLVHGKVSGAISNTIVLGQCMLAVHKVR